MSLQVIDALCSSPDCLEKFIQMLSFFLVSHLVQPSRLRLSVPCP